MQISMEPFLVNLLPHLVKFVESKSQTLICSAPSQPNDLNARQPVPGDVPLLGLILQVLQAIFENKFFDID